MPLITRVSRLFRADLHAVLDRVEEPDILLRQAIREMEEEQSRDEQRGRSLQQQQRQILSRRQDIEQSLQRLEDELDVSFAADKENLARGLVKRRLEAQQFLRFLARKHAGVEEELKQLNQRLGNNRSRLDAMRQKVELLVEEQADRPLDEPWTPPDFSVTDEDVEVAFLQEQQRRRPS
ncbi:MAG: PspA/IM30 family protein [Pseudomonadota bacterium]